MRPIGCAPGIAVRGPGWLLLALLSAVALAPLPVAAAPLAATGEYRLQPGDVVEVSIADIAGFRERAPIGIDGAITLPLAGRVEIGGEKLAEAAKAISHGLAGKVYRQLALDGQEVSHLILANEVMTTVAEYRPVYVMGDVAKPGDYPFRPGLTVRQVVAVAGGYGLARLGPVNPWIAGVDLESEYTALWNQLASEQARAWLLRKELAALGAEKATDPAPAQGGPAARFMQTAKQELEWRLASRAAEKASYRAAIDKAGQQLLTLEKKKSEDKQGVAADEAEYENVRQLFEKRLSTAMRLSEARRAALLSSDQYLQTIVEIANLERQRDQSSRLLAKVDNDARVAALAELQTAMVNIAQISARLEGASEKLVLTGAMQSELGHESEPPRIAIHRTIEGREGEFAAGPDQSLMPGDVVDVTVHLPGALPAPAARVATQ